MSPEIARLQNSLKLLRATQQELKEAIAESPDPEFTQALEENDQTMWAYTSLKLVYITFLRVLRSGSQQERVSMLKMVLTEKGIPTGPLNLDSEPASVARETNRSRSIPQETDDGGIDLWILWLFLSGVS